MAMRDKLRTNAQPHLEPGETIQAIFPAQTGMSPYYFFLTYLLVFWMQFIVIAATDRRILVFKSSKWRPTTLKEVMGKFPRETRLGPISGLIWAKFDLRGKSCWVHRRFYKDARAVDAVAEQPQAGMPVTA